MILNPFTNPGYKDNNCSRVAYLNASMIFGYLSIT